MAVIAVAGGTGGVGRAIVDALLLQGKHDVKILSREENAAKEAEIGVPVIAVDYTDISTLVDVLEQNQVHTVISSLNMMPFTAGHLEPNLVKAADASKTTKRMVSSDYGFDYLKEEAHMLHSTPTKMAAWDVLMATKDLEWTVFRNGYFMDSLGAPKVKSHMQTNPCIIDLANNMAAIPGDGNTPVTFTHTSDIGKFVAASIELESWDHITYVAGDKATWNQIVQVAEEVKGTKFNVVYDSPEKLQKGEITELPSYTQVYDFLPKPKFQALTAAFGLWFDRGDFNIDNSRTLNGKLPEIETLKIRDVLEKGWGK